MSLPSIVSIWKSRCRVSRPGMLQQLSDTSMDGSGITRCEVKQRLP